MKLALIYPNIGRKEHGMFLDGAKMEPLGLAVLAGLTPPAVETILFDDRLEDIPYDGDFDLVAISVQIFTARRSYEISDEFRRRGTPVVLGGVHVTLIPEEAEAHADALVLGDAENVWQELLEDARAGNLKKKYMGRTAERPQNGTRARREIFAGKKYLPVTLMQFSRGCPNRCEFCASGVYFDKRHHTRDVGDVTDEIRAQKRKLVFFTDDNIVADKEAAKELFKALIPLKIRWVSQASMDMLDDGELMNLMVKSGCLGNVIGFESIGQTGIEEMRKDSNARFIEDGYERAVAELRRYGQQTWAAFTVGHDADTVELIRETCDFALRHKFCFAAFNILNPYPGTDLYRRLAEENRLLYGGKWWLHPEYRFNHASFVPKNMSPDELTAESFRCRQRFNGAGSILRRAFEPRTNMRSPYRFFAYLAYNPIFRREVFNKQGILFGYEKG
ncbi:MAG: B12-binding domain-containing radical SAM protein [Clostridiales Family XIII bacterium]|jgi:radical SAM superfamily enzyme YgiQ (UPF0313 family)|nr:B12-binding domain-containing radical SAM protein [Clostridiales Family XIII bacterium]